MKQISNSNKSSEKGLLLILTIIGLGGLFLTFKSTPKEKHLDLDSIRLESKILTQEDGRNMTEDYVLR
ncbi:MAG: hypothetical protein R2824_35075 [Saprospiraceae bacterium]|nr:hypothetical protein [Lewinella sp.]